MEINGKRINTIIDNGAPMFVVDEKIAEEIGINLASKRKILNLLVVIVLELILVKPIHLP